LGNRFCITDRLKTFSPKISPGVSSAENVTAGGT
jgi:hypothetical protein